MIPQALHAAPHIPVVRNYLRPPADTGIQVQLPNSMFSISHGVCRPTPSINSSNGYATPASKPNAVRNHASAPAPPGVGHAEAMPLAATLHPSCWKVRCSAAAVAQSRFRACWNGSSLPAQPHACPAAAGLLLLLLWPPPVDARSPSPLAPAPSLLVLSPLPKFLARTRVFGLVP